MKNMFSLVICLIILVLCSSTTMKSKAKAAAFKAKTQNGCELNCVADVNCIVCDPSPSLCSGTCQCDQPGCVCYCYSG